MSIERFLSRLLTRPTVSSPEIISKLRDIETTQRQILSVLAELKHDEIPRNADRIYKIGRARTALFLNELLPQVYLTLVSVLQGVTLAVLVDQFRFDYWATNPAIYGYIASSFLIVIAFWYSYLTAVFDGRWPLHIIDTILFFTAASAEALAFRNVGAPSYWCLAIGVMSVVVAIIYLRQEPLLRGQLKAHVFDDPKEVSARIQGVRILTVLFVIVAALAFLLAPVVASDPGNLFVPAIAVLIPAGYIAFVVRISSKFSTV